MTSIRNSIEILMKESRSGLRNLINNASKNLRDLETFREPTEHWDTSIVYLISTKFEKATSRE